jgi:branched-chain amino acid transport system permease protein
VIARFQPGGLLSLFTRRSKPTKDTGAGHAP